METAIQPASARRAPETGRGCPVPGMRGTCWVLTGMYMFSFVDRQILSLLIPSIKKDYGVSDTQIGLLVGLAFALFYTLMDCRWENGGYLQAAKRDFGFGCSLEFFHQSVCRHEKLSDLVSNPHRVGVGEAGLGPAAYSLISICSQIAHQHRHKRLLLRLFLGSSLALVVGELQSTRWRGHHHLGPLLALLPRGV